MGILKLSDYSKEEKREIGIVFSILAVSVLAGIFVGFNEEWIPRRNFTAGYMAGSLATAIVLFGIYRSIAFFFEKNKK